ncbi:hypothetical protein BO91_02240 [Candidatus Synechococcus spongiarum LMB bulk10E]|uniref:HEPN domain-containing protein n=1 Tax=Candidatus Synechococcus spongiarum LMB bulk15M TaxID=1943582 RepID=A0A1T1CZR0_9SYNE|nr:hypothetical protein BO91_02240 [Candidatus Synechococcus spongiarum LMB bulk10E]OOV34077.1 hypothetical protein BV61_03435 [Candidatus Synechococcus spongiarum LMB bulk15M]OOV36739.1 hypothetical protein BO98_00550 [Candidatus Synechococcus spongiarum LMB bulk10D]
MTLHVDLLEQAFHLAMRERKKPRQASLRRSVSASYYALFHLLIDAAVKRAFPGKDRSVLRNYLARTISHSHIKNLAQDFSKASVSENLYPVLNINTIDERLVSVAKAVIKLQIARHDADYNLNKKFVRNKVIDYINITKKAFDDWKQIDKTIEADIFLFRMFNYKVLRK